MAARRRSRPDDSSPPMPIFAAGRPPSDRGRKPTPRWVIPVLVGALVVAAGIATAAYWPSARPAGTAPLQATVEINRTSGPHPLTITVVANVSGGTPPYQYTWTFGDGGAASAAGASHVYRNRGTYQVLLRVTDRDNRTTAAGVTVHVEAVHQRKTFLNATAETLGAGETKAWIVPISIPSTENSTWIYGKTNVTGCSLSGNCDAYVEVLNAYDETNLTQGGSITNPIWCFEVDGSCQANRTVDVAVNLDNLAGQTVYFVVFNTNLVWSQTVSAVEWTDWWY